MKIEQMLGSQGTPEEIKKAETENLTEEQKKLSEEREATLLEGAKKGFEVGKINGNLNMLQFALEYEELSDKAKKVLINKIAVPTNDPATIVLQISRMYEEYESERTDPAVIVELLNKLKIKKIEIRNMLNEVYPLFKEYTEGRISNIPSLEVRTIMEIANNFPNIEIILDSRHAAGSGEKILQKFVNKCRLEAENKK